MLFMRKASEPSLWLGGWAGRLDPPVPLDWSSVKIKKLGVFVGPGDLEEDNWQPWIDAVEKVLSSWRQWSLSFKGKALVINALALSRVWYVPSLIHMPYWVVSKLVRLTFHFFWGGKRDLVRRSVVVQPPDQGGFSVVDVQQKVSSLLVQWVRRFVSSYANWSHFLTFWFFSVFNCSVLDVLSKNFSSLDSSKRDSKILFSAHLRLRRKKKRVGFSPSLNHRARERIFAPSHSLLMTVSKADSSLFTFEIWSRSPRKTADLALSKRLVKELRSERSCLHFREEKSIQVRRI